MSRYYRALVFAAMYHQGQKRRGGEEYIAHPIRVANNVDGEQEKVVALLHDVVEDTDCTFKDVYDYFGPEVVRSVYSLTHKKGESYRDYIRRVMKDDVAVKVKMADIADNLSDSPSENQIKKGAMAIAMLMDYAANRHD